MAPMTSRPQGAWVGSVTPVPPPASANPTLRTLGYAAVVTGAWSGLASLLISLVGRAFGVDYDAAIPGTGVVEAISWTFLLLAPLALALVGALLCTPLLGRPSGGRIAWWGGTLIALASLAVPLLWQPAEVAWTTRVWLCIPHLTTWWLVVPQLARIVGDAEPGASAERGE